MNEHEMLVYVVATRPYPEKVSISKFWFTREDALKYQTHMNEYLNGFTKENIEYFKIYEARLIIKE